MAKSIGKGVKARIRRALPPSVVATARRRVLGRKPTLHSLEFHVTDHCNLNCKGCGHFSCISPPFFADVDEFKHDVNRLAELFSRIDVFTLLGGEPLLHPRVLDFVVEARRALPGSRIHLTTNGVILPKMSAQFWTTLHSNDVQLNISSYPVKRDDEAIAALADEHGVPLHYTDSRAEFYCIPLDESGSSHPAESRAKCLELANCPFLRGGRIYPCAYPPLAFALEDRFDVAFPVGENDYIDIHRSDVDGFAIAEFLARAIPFCRFCNMKRLRYFEWDRSSRSLEEWT